MNKLTDFRTFFHKRTKITENQSSQKPLTDDFARKIMLGYLEAALWTEEERIGQEYKNLDFNVHNFTEDAEIDVYEDIRKFISGLSEKTVAFLKSDGIEPSQIGHDLWLTRNGHGAGFWDRGLDEEIEEDIMDSIEEMRKERKWEMILYVGDDGRFSFE